MITLPSCDLAGKRIWVMAKGYAAEEGGMQTYAEGVAQGWANAGAQVTVFTQTRLGRRMLDLGRVRLVDVGAKPAATLPLRLRLAMRREQRRHGAPDLVHGTTWRTSVVPMVLGLPFVTTFHGREFMYGGGGRLLLKRLIARRARAICAVSKYSAARLRARLGDECPPVVVAWNGLGPAMQCDTAPQATDVPLIFSLCRLEPRKNIAACVAALATLRDEGLAFRYVIAGRGPELEAIRAMVVAFRLEDRVEVAGFVPAERAAQLYAACDIFLHPQIAADDGRDFEGFGIAIADAMAAHSAVVVGSEGGAIELVEQGVTGLAVEGRDHAALTEAVRLLLTDRKLREKMAQAAAEHARRTFCWNAHVALIHAGCERRADGATLSG